MSDFIAEIRGPRIPTSCLDFNSDPDDFVAELRPRSMRAAPAPVSQMASNCCFDEMADRTCPSDEDLKGALAAKSFSTHQMTEMLQNSIFILIQKFLSGKGIATVSGNICVSFQDNTEPPLYLDFHDSNAYPESLDWCDERRPPKLIRAEDISDSYDREGVYLPQDELTSLKYAADVPTRMPPLYTEQSPVDDSDTLYSLAVQPRMPCLWRRRDSDTESGYSSKCHDEMMDAESVHDIDVDGEPDHRNHHETRSCPSADSLGSLTDAERLKLETSCEKNKGHSYNGNNRDGETNVVVEDDDDDDRLPALVIDESVDDRCAKEDSIITDHKEEVNKLEDAKQSALPQHNMCAPNSQSGSPSSLVDLSGDSEHSKGGLSPQAMGAHHSHNMAQETRNRVPEQVVLVSKVSDPEYRSPMHAHDQPRRSYDDTEGQLLDLSMKKKPSNGQEKASDDLNVTQGAAPSNKLGDNLSRDGYSLPSSDRLPLTVCDIVNRQRIEEAMTREGAYYQNKPSQHKVVANDHLLVVPNVTRIEGHNRPRSAEVPSVDRPEAYLSRSRSMQPSMGSARYSPYNRERLALLAARFLTSRKQQPTSDLSRPEERPIRMPIIDSGKTTDGVHSAREFPINTFTSPQSTTFQDKAAAREASFSETTLKNRVNAFVRNGGHHSNTTSTPLPTNTNITSVGSITDNSKENSSVSKAAGSWKRTDGSFTCIHGECGQQFVTFQALERHSIDNHGRYLCEHCGKGFTARPNRDRHARYHTGERPYKCDLCPQAFFRGDDLKYHRTTRHPGAEPYVCTKCNRSFAWGRDLDRHLRQAKCKA